jgi:hypothetical protein
MSKVKFIALTSAILMLLMGAVALALPPTVVWVGTPLQPGSFWGYNQFTTIDSGVVAVLAGGTVNVLAGTYVLPSTVNLNKVNLTVKGAGVTTIVQVATAVGYAFNISASGVTLRDIKLQKTGGTGPHYLIMVNANNVSILNNTIYGPAPTLPWSYTSCAMNVAGGLTGLLINNNTIYDLRFPAEIAATTVGTISNNAVSRSEGWQNNGANLTFTANSWPLPPNQGAEIVLLAAVNPIWYPDLKLLSTSNNDAFIDAQFVGGDKGRVTTYVDKAAAAGGLGSVLAPFQKITDGVAGTLDGTIYVAAGTYNEGPQIVIAKDLSIIGVNKTTVIIKPTANTGDTGDPRGWFLVNAGVVFNLTGVTLDGTGFKIWQGIRSRGSGTIDNNIIKNIGYNPSTDYAGTGIVAFGDNGTVISNNTFSNIGRVGTLIYGVTATYGPGNSYTGKSTIPNDYLDYGVELGAGAVADVIGNTFTACRGVATVDGSTSAGAIATTYYVAGGTTGHFKGNTFTDSYAGIDIGCNGGFVTPDASIVTVTDGNKFDGNDYGIKTTASAAISLTVLGNTFQNNSIIGLDVHSALANVQSNVFCCGNTLNASDDVPYGTNTYDMNYWNDWSGVGAYYNIFPGPLPGANVDWNPSAAYGLDMTPNVIPYSAIGTFDLKVNIEKCVLGLNAANIWLTYPAQLSATVTALDPNFTVYSTQTANTGLVNILDTLKVQLGVMTGNTSGPDELFKVTFSGTTSCIPLTSTISMIFRDLRDNLNAAILAPLASPTTFTSNPPTIAFDALVTPAGGYYNHAPSVNLSAAYGCDLLKVWYQVDGGAWLTVAAGLTTPTWSAVWTMPALDFNNPLLLDNTSHSILFWVDAADGRYGTTTWTFTKDMTPPAAPTGLAATPGHNKVHLVWTNPTPGPTPPLDYDHTVIMRTDWCVYGHAWPLYGLSPAPKDVEGPNPLNTTVTPIVDQVYSGSAATYIDLNDLSNTTRDIYHYAAFAVDKAGNVSVASTPAKSTSYWLGDINKDGYVKVEDLGAFSSTYGLSTGNTGYKDEVDFAPAFGGAKGIPAPDGTINFEELSIFAINYDAVSPTLKTRPTLPGIPIQRETGLRVAQRMTTTTFDVDLYLDNRDNLAKALIGEVTYDPTMLEYVSTVEGKDLAASQLPVFFKALTLPKQISVSAAVLGNGSTIDGSGLIATISFRVLGSGKTTVQLTRADVRDKDNRNLVAENIQLPEAEAVATVDVPATYQIEQNQPNPFNPETVIKYALPSATQVSVRIYNVVGQLVKTLVDDYQPAGQHQVVWNGTNENGERVASGIYLYRFVTPDHQKTLKMTLLK